MSERSCGSLSSGSKNFLRPGSGIRVCTVLDSFENLRPGVSKDVKETNLFLSPKLYWTKTTLEKDTGDIF